MQNREKLDVWYSALECNLTKGSVLRGGFGWRRAREESRGGSGWRRSKGATSEKETRNE